MSPIRGPGRTSLCLALSSIACSSGTIPGTVDGAVTQVTVDRSVGSWRAVLVLAVDDGPSMAAAAIRAATAQVLPATLRQLAFRTWEGLPSDWHPADVRVVVVRPSREGWDSIVSPDDDPALDLVTDNASDDAIEATADAVTRLINAVPAEAGAPYSLLDTTGRALDLVAGTAAPEDAHEVRLVKSVDNPDVVALVIATSRDDESVHAGLSPEWWKLGPRPRWFASPVLLTSLNANPDDCFSPIDSRSHLGAWVALDRATEWSFPVDVHFASCLARDDAASSLNGIFELNAHIESICLSFALATRPEGGAACRVVATLDDDSPCASHPGMLDPLDADGQRRPRTDTLIGIAAVGSVCEINELAGAEAIACSSMGDCSGCSPGWCATTGDPAHGCPTDFRFVGGAVPRHRALVHFVCDVAR
jgi:hypothetical protein